MVPSGDRRSPSLPHAACATVPRSWTRPR